MKYLVTLLCLALLAVISNDSSAANYFVEDQQAYKAAVKKLKPGDVITLRNGEWRDFEIVLKGKGTAQQPITLTAETKGKVTLTGQSNLRLAGQFLVVSGLIFKDGYTPSSAVVSFRRNKQDLAYHSRVTEIVIDNFNNPDKQESDYWVAMYGQHNRFDHNHLEGKRNRGVTLAVRLDSQNSQNNHHSIDHNYFGYRPTFGSNGGETIRIGTSHYSLSDSFTVVENNYFEKTNGEVEIISVKSGKNILRGNVFLEAQGTLTLRHGNGNLVENNVFLGNKVPHTGGIRVINRNQTIRNNYLKELTGYRFGSGFTVMNGVPNSPINRYHQVDNAVIEGNTFIDVSHIQLAAGSDSERSAVPINSQFNNNVVFQSDRKQPFTLFDDIGGVKFSGNTSNVSVPEALSTGFNVQDLTLEPEANGLVYPKGLNANRGASRNLPVIAKAMTGVSWYEKRPAMVDFDSGSTHKVQANPKALIQALADAKSGDILSLAPGHYVVPKLLVIDKVISITAQVPGSVTLTFERSSLFEITDGGSLKLTHLTISGADSPDSAGNSAIRSKKWGMVENYRLQLAHMKVIDLNVNHTFDFFRSGKGAFADLIEIKESQFGHVSGDILRLNTEIEDLGIYNAEYVEVSNCTFENVQGAVVKLYRGGTDESTFGPHLRFEHNQVKASGRGKRNKSKSSMHLHGVQQTLVAHNTLSLSAPIVVEHTVGEPQTDISNNRFIDTIGPDVSELRALGPHTAVLENNTIIETSNEK